MGQGLSLGSGQQVKILQHKYTNILVKVPVTFQGLGQGSNIS